MLVEPYWSQMSVSAWAGRECATAAPVPAMSRPATARARMIRRMTPRFWGRGAGDSLGGDVVDVHRRAAAGAAGRQELHADLADVVAAGDAAEVQGQVRAGAADGGGAAVVPLPAGADLDVQLGLGAGGVVAPRRDPGGGAQRGGAGQVPGGDAGEVDLVAAGEVDVGLERVAALAGPLVDLPGAAGDVDAGPALGAGFEAGQQGAAARRRRGPAAGLDDGGQVDLAPVEDPGVVVEGRGALVAGRAPGVVPVQEVRRPRVAGVEGGGPPAEVERAGGVRADLGEGERSAQPDELVVRGDDAGGLRVVVVGVQADHVDVRGVVVGGDVAPAEVGGVLPDQVVQALGAGEVVVHLLPDLLERGRVLVAPPEPVAVDLVEG